MSHKEKILEFQEVGFCQVAQGIQTQHGPHSEP